MIDPHIARLDTPEVVKMKVTEPIEQAYRVAAAAKEPWMAPWLRSIPRGSVVFDLGANVGSYALLAIALGHQVVALEPGFANFARLCDNLVLNNWLDKCVPIQAAVAGMTRLDWFQYRDLTAGAASHLIGQPPGQHPVFFHRQAIQVWRLDDLIATFKLPQPQYLKLDIDGGESQALAGAEETLKGVQGMMAEVKPQQEAAILAYLAKRGFELVGRWDERGGKKIGVAYIQVARKAA